ncbi:hypothetical protein SLS60_011993 [Paraconiothyrium brasiliense]|uniref:DNA polymerase delta subunit 3 n=1 Tax=Paraconiothyrium brasiliense TaxID=300254 RepID=A0ABR3QGT4_9PLEO
MLYEFHTTELAKKPKSVHATYLLTGKKRSFEHSNGVGAHDGDDTVMHSSPLMSSLPEPDNTPERPVTKTSIVLVREEELQRTKADFQEITSIHIYSLEPGPIENLNLLAVCNQERRTTKYTPTIAKSAPKATATPTTAANAAKEEKKGEPAAATRKDSNLEESRSGRSTPQPGLTASLKRSDSKTKAKKDTSAGDLFKSFAKAKPKAKEAEEQGHEDEAMQGMSEDEGDADDEPTIKFDTEKATAARKVREEREQKLKEMMEADVDMPDAPVEEEKDSQDAPIDKEPPSKPSESEATVTVQGGRRRGRRRVMKKKKVKDEDGYLVTKEEAVWESFSEDEPEPKKAKSTPKPTTTKGKKTGGKSQGSIASFFKKA